MKLDTPVLRSTRLLDQVRGRVRYFHYSLSTEKCLPVLGALFRPLAGDARGMRQPHTHVVGNARCF